MTRFGLPLGSRLKCKTTIVEYLEGRISESKVHLSFKTIISGPRLNNNTIDQSLSNLRIAKGPLALHYTQSTKPP